jgi:hypothetical protein
MAEISFSGRRTTVKKVSLAPRPTTLKGKTVALYHNDKIASYPVMRVIREKLQPLGVKEVFEVHSHTPWSHHPDSAIQEALKADVVFAGTCD